MLKELLEESCRGCWPCDLMAMIIDAFDKLAEAFLRNVQQKKYPLIMLGWGFAFWIAFHVLKMLMTFSDSKFFSTFFKQAVACTVAAVFLGLPLTSMVDWFITPFFQFGEGVSKALSEAAASPGTKAAGEAEGSGIDSSLYDTLGVDRSTCEYKVKNKYALHVFSEDLKKSILNMTSNLYQTIAPPVIIGQVLMCYSQSKGATEIPIVNIIIPDFGMLIIGATIVGSFTLMMVLVPFYFADVLVKVGFVVTLLPFFVVAAAFDKTRHITKNAVNVILSALALFIDSCAMMGHIIIFL